MLFLFMRGLHITCVLVSNYFLLLLVCYFCM
uniref:Uncharacterized protein n=1 Tax=Arundo donax TaxID=35708 RepID=A0A0A8ZK17_ARUDO